MNEPSLDSLLANARACTLCTDALQTGVRPIMQLSATARILIAGQAPGAKVHASGIPFDDASGERLRNWMGIDSTTFYDASQVAILPMGFCYPGKGKSGDLPPRPICAKTWRKPFLEALPDITLTLAIGQYAQSWHLPSRQPTVTETVKQWRDYDTSVLPLPHPSPRNNLWMKRNPWFEETLLPVLKNRVKKALT